MVTVKLKTIELGQDEIVNSYRNTPNKQSKTRKLKSTCSKLKKKIFKLFTKPRIHPAINIDSEQASNTNHGTVPTLGITTPLVNMTNHEHITDETLQDQIDNTTNYLQHLSADDEEGTHIEPIASRDTQLDNTVLPISHVCLDTADSIEFSTNETTADQQDLGTTGRFNVCFHATTTDQQEVPMTEHAHILTRTPLINMT